MKKLILSLTTFLAASVPCFSNQPEKEFSQVKVEVHFKGLDAKWLSGVGPKVSQSLYKDDGKIALPAVTGRAGHPAKLEIIQQFSSKPGGSIIPCGIIYDLNPQLDGENIHLSGSSILRYPTDKLDDHTASQFITQENLVDITLRNGETKSISLNGGGEMLITATFINAEGRSIK